MLRSRKFIGIGVLFLALLVGLTASYLRTSPLAQVGGGGGFAPKVDYPTGEYLYRIAIGDLNGDGKPDLASSSTNNVFVRLNNSDGTFAAAVGARFGSQPHSIG